MTQTMVEQLQQAPRPAGMERVLAFLNDKGGVGKTTLCANLGGQCAAAGYKVLIIDLNRQANLSDDLGYRDRAGVDDQGENLLEAIRRPDRTVLVAHEVRPGLWAVPGGEELEDLTSLVTSRVQKEGRQAYLALAAAIAQVASGYDLILIDSPPENVVLQDLALAAARWTIMPTKSDPGGLVGMKLTSKRFKAALDLNPGLGLLGVVLFGTLKSATAIQAEVRADVREAFGGHDAMLSATVRSSERVARDMRNLGRLAHELEVDAAAQPAWWQSLREGKPPSRRFSTSTASVAGDFRDFAGEVLQVLAKAEQPRMDGGTE